MLLDTVHNHPESSSVPNDGVNGTVALSEELVSMPLPGSPFLLQVDLYVVVACLTVRLLFPSSVFSSYFHGRYACGIGFSRSPTNLKCFVTAIIGVGTFTMSCTSLFGELLHRYQVGMRQVTCTDSVLVSVRSSTSP